MTEVRREIVKVGIDFRPIPVDMGDGVVWDFASDPTPGQWSGLVGSLSSFMDAVDTEGNFAGAAFETGLVGLTAAIADLLVDPEQKKLWNKRGYGLGPQQAVAEALMEAWTGFPSESPSRSGKGSRKTGSRL